MHIEGDPNPYSAPLTPISVARNRFPWLRWRIVPMAVCWLTGSLLVLGRVILMGSFLVEAIQGSHASASERLGALAYFVVLGLHGVLLMYAAVQWKRGRWLLAASLSLLGGMLPFTGAALVFGLGPMLFHWMNST